MYGGGSTESASALQTSFAQAGIRIKLFCSGIPLQREPLILLLCQTSSLEGLNMGKSKKNTQSQLPVILGIQMAVHLTQNKELYYWKISSQHVQTGIHQFWSSWEGSTLTCHENSKEALSLVVYAPGLGIELTIPFFQRDISSATELQAVTFYGGTFILVKSPLLDFMRYLCVKQRHVHMTLCSHY